MLPVIVAPDWLLIVMEPAAVPAASVMLPVIVPVLVIARELAPVVEAFKMIEPVRLPLFVIVSGAIVTIEPEIVPALVTVVRSCVVMPPANIPPVTLLTVTVPGTVPAVCTRLPETAPELLISVVPTLVMLPRMP